MNVHIAVFFFKKKKKPQQCQRFLPAVSFAMVLGLLTCALRFLSACYDRVCFSSLVMVLFLLIVLPHDDSSSGGTACTSGELVATRVRSTLLSCLLFSPKPPGTSPPDFIESSLLENPIWYRNGA